MAARTPMTQAYQSVGPLEVDPSLDSPSEQATSRKRRMDDEESDAEACPARRPCIETPGTAILLDGNRQHESETESESEEAVSSSPSADDDPPTRRPHLGNHGVDMRLGSSRQRKRPAGEEEASSPPPLKSRRR